MNTADTEWEKKFDGLKVNDEWYTSGDSDNRDMLVVEIKTFITQLLSSRDTYWKEKMGKECDIRIRKEAEELTRKKIAHGKAMYEKGKTERD